jgi:hypothetical protein
MNPGVVVIRCQCDKPSSIAKGNKSGRERGKGNEEKMALVSTNAQLKGREHAWSEPKQSPCMSLWRWCPQFGSWYGTERSHSPSSRWKQLYVRREIRSADGTGTSWGQRTSAWGILLDNSRALGLPVGSVTFEEVNSALSGVFLYTSHTS